MKHLTTFAVATLAVFASAPAQSALLITQDTAIAAARTAFGGTTALDWNAGGAPGSASGSINIAQWITGDGFEGLDLAINGAENVTWNFATPVSRIGFAIATGLGLFPSEVDNTGAVFNLLTDTGETGTLTLVDGGSGYSAWVEINAANPFSSLSFSEPSGNIQDQYWGNVFAATAAVPEPATWAIMLTGFGLIGYAMRGRRRIRVSFV